MSGLGDLAASQPLLIVAVIAVLLAAAGWMTERDRPALARNLRNGGYLGMLGAGLLLVGQLAHDADKSDAAILMGSQPRITVEGRETVVPKASDGHFWITARVDGADVDFLIDTGASLTGLSKGNARRAGIAPDPNELPIEMNTANGKLMTTIGRAREVSFGNITVRNLEVAVPRDLEDDTNVIGMNLLSQLASWRVEGGRLILVPKG